MGWWWDGAGGMDGVGGVAWGDSNQFDGMLHVVLAMPSNWCD